MRLSTKIYDLTPTNEFYLIGYGDLYKSRTNPADGIHDRVYANTLLMEVDNELCFIFNADFIEFEEDFCNEMKQLLSSEFEICQSSILFSATHNHSSIMSYHKTWETGKFDISYYNELKKVVINSFKENLGNLVDVDVSTRKIIIDDFYGSRIIPDYDGDKEVILIEFKDHSGSLISGIMNISVHSTVLGPNNSFLSSDLAGNIRSKFYEKHKYHPLMIIGAAADMSNRFYRQSADFDELERVSQGIVNQIIEFEENSELVFSKLEIKEITHTINYDMKVKYNELTDRIDTLKKLVENETNEDKIKIYNSEIWACQMKLSQKHVNFTLKTTIVNLGDLLIVTFPGELYSDFGKMIKESTDKCCLIFGYTNGHYHYFMPDYLYGKTFESQLSLIPKGEIEKYVISIIDQIQTM